MRHSSAPPVRVPPAPAGHAWNLLGALRRRDLGALRRELDSTERSCRHTGPCTARQAEEMELLAALAGHLRSCAGGLEEPTPPAGLEVDRALLAHLLRNRPPHSN